MWVAREHRYMSSDTGDPDAERAAVTTYVPRYQKRAWTDHAEELGVSRSEFVAMMVQAGRQGLYDVEKRTDEEERTTVEEDDPDDKTPGVRSVEDRLLDALREMDHPSWEELVERVAGDVEEQVDDTLSGLQAENRVTYAGRHGGYVLDDGE